MSFLRTGFARCARPTASTSRQASRNASSLRSPSAPFPSVESCPSPTCACADMPPDLDIERTKPLNGTMAAHNQHLLVSTGQTDWKSKIEDEADTAPWGRFIASIKTETGKDGQFFDPYRSIMTSASSFHPRAPRGGAKNTSNSNDHAEALLFPSFIRVEGLSTSPDDTASFILSFLVQEAKKRDSIYPETTQPANPEALKYLKPSEMTPDERAAAESKPLPSHQPTSTNYSTTLILTPTILICSHNSRDTRCGILGPLLQSEFSRYLTERQSNTTNSQNTETYFIPNTEVFLPQPPSGTSDPTTPTSSPSSSTSSAPPEQHVNIGLISHIGGHAWAGNVILYIPPKYTGPNFAGKIDDGVAEYHPLAGKSIWYGRVEPKHVEGIVEETLIKGIVISELFRGGVGHDGEIIRW